MRMIKTISFVFGVLLLVAPTMGRTQAALLLEQPYGFFGALNPTGHEAIYLARVCADSPTKLRRCNADETGVVISRYKGIDHFDWLAIPLVPYLYSVENIDDAPRSVNHETVAQLRNRYREQHLLGLGEDVRAASFFNGGWTELIGGSYERRIYAFRFDTTEAQDDSLIEMLNGSANISHFKLLYNNCADFTRVVLNNYFPGEFKRSIFPDAGATTPKQITYKLVKYAHKHRETNLQVLVIPQIPGYRHHSFSNHGIAESLITTGYAIPIVVINPYLAGGLFVDYLVRGGHNLVPKNPILANPENLDELTRTEEAVKNSTGDQAQDATPITAEKVSPSSHE